MPQTTPKLKWTAIGKQLTVRASGELLPGPDPTSTGEIDIKEFDKSVDMSEDPDFPPAGIPIDANLATYLIKTLHDKLPVINQPGPIEFTEFEKWIVSLLLSSRAITVDKSVLLKIISQPECEGIRFYPCLKSTKPGAGVYEPTDAFSLVMIGTDKDGKDLGYDYDEIRKTEVENNIYRIPTISLTTEYGYPPPPRLTDPYSAELFVLGSYAWKIV